MTLSGSYLDSSSSKNSTRSRKEIADTSVSPGGPPLGQQQEHQLSSKSSNVGISMDLVLARNLVDEKHWHWPEKPAAREAPHRYAAEMTHTLIQFGDMLGKRHLYHSMGINDLAFPKDTWPSTSTPIHRAVDESVARSMLNDQLRRQLYFDGL